MSRAWDKSQDDTLRQMYPGTPTSVLATRLGRTLTSTYQRARKLGLAKSEEYRAQERARSTVQLVTSGAPYRYSSGHATWNQGMKGLNIGGKETRFRKGNKPASSWKQIGTERIDTKDGYLVRKISDTGVRRVDWVLVHVHVWTQHHGPLPPGHAVVFKDGNKRNFDPANLEAISRRELMKRNTIHNYPPEIAKTIQLIGALNRKINHG